MAAAPSVACMNSSLSLCSTCERLPAATGTWMFSNRVTGQSFIFSSPLPDTAEPAACMTELAGLGGLTSRSTARTHDLLRMISHLQTFQIVTQDTLNVVHAVDHVILDTQRLYNGTSVGSEWELHHSYKPNKQTFPNLSELTGTSTLPIHCK